MSGKTLLELKPDRLRRNVGTDGEPLQSIENGATFLERILMSAVCQELLQCWQDCEAMAQ
ncbi:hypothetical protein KIN20_029237 [Parelaphostrongylus tenuis]|uniref:Uncharacterized protein n=1 Tax=Parelaphostrongylus tenuis TaxID=148309 RepID=A0AAD5WFC0_PARTN|nr:hypothetical protein KIN20_029237 [Parelaphostrongylus tenuis]